MGIRLTELVKAAERFADFAAAQEHAPPDVVAKERLKLGIKNAERFSLKSEQLSVLANAVSKAYVDVAPTAAAPVASGEAPTAAPAAPAPTPQDVAPPLLPETAAREEVAFGANDLRPIRYLHMALWAARAVGKLTVRGAMDEEGDATGFLVAPGLLLTNWHVLKTSMAAEVSFVTFDYEDGLDGRPKNPKLFDLNPRELFVSDEALDFALVAVSPTTAQGDSLAEFGYLRLFEETGKVDPNRRQAANIVQHPLGQPKQLVLRDNFFMEPPKDAIGGSGQLNSLYYGSDTLKGSSGSPVCTDSWFVVALHRGGVPVIKEVEGRRVVMRRDGTQARDGDSRASIAYLTNEGTRVSRIYASLRDKAALGSPDARHAGAALARMEASAADFKLGPFHQPTAFLGVPRDLAPEDGGIEEKLVRRPVAFFTGEGVAGYRDSFLGAQHVVPFPTLSFEAQKEVAKLRGSQEFELKYLNYSIVMHAKRRTAIVAGANIDGGRLWKVVMDGKMPGRPAWTFDPRMDDQYQPDDDIFSNAMQRGHLFKREDAVQGESADELALADKHSFVITNATPMIGNFNNVEWGDLEDIITRHLGEGNRLSYFAGPIFAVEDPYFNELKANVPKADRRKGMRVPTQFWKVVVWVEGGRLRSAGFILDQGDEIREHGPIHEEKLTFGSYKQSPIAVISERTGVLFPEMEAVDTYRP